MGCAIVMDMSYITVTGHGLCNSYGYELYNSYWTWAV